MGLLFIVLLGIAAEIYQRFAARRRVRTNPTWEALPESGIAALVSVEVSAEGQIVTQQI